MNSLLAIITTPPAKPQHGLMLLVTLILIGLLVLIVAKILKLVVDIWAEEEEVRRIRALERREFNDAKSAGHAREASRTKELHQQIEADARKKSAWRKLPWGKSKL